MKILKIILYSLEYILIALFIIKFFNFYDKNHMTMLVVPLVLSIYYIFYTIFSVYNIVNILRKPINEELTKKLNEKYKEVKGSIRVVKDNKFSAYTIHSFINDIIVISENIVKELNEDMIDVIIYHEIGHIYYRHFERRFMMDVLFATIVVSVAIYVGFIFSIPFAIFFKWMYIQIIKQHELEADEYSVMKTRKPEVLKFVLLMSSQDKTSLFFEHPILSKRIEHIDKIIKTLKQNEHI